MAFMPSRNSSIRLLSRFTYSPTPSRITVGWVSGASHSLSAGGSLARVHGAGCRDTFGHGTRRWQAARKAAGTDPGTGRDPVLLWGTSPRRLWGAIQRSGEMGWRSQSMIFKGRPFTSSRRSSTFFRRSFRSSRRSWIRLLSRGNVGMLSPPG